MNQDKKSWKTQFQNSLERWSDKFDHDDLLESIDNRINNGDVIEYDLKALNIDSGDLFGLFFKAIVNQKLSHIYRDFEFVLKKPSLP